MKMYISANVWMYAYWSEHMDDLSPEEFASLIIDAMPEKLRTYVNS